MKLSLNWIKEYTGVGVSVEELVGKIGSQLGAVDDVVSYGSQYGSAIIVNVVSCKKHPNADKLSICQINDGGKIKDVPRESDLVQVICGAPNIEAGQNVIWLPPGAIVPNTANDKNPFVLGSKELRGVMSHGMIASAKELALGEDHNGILVLHEKIKPGVTLADHLKLDDVVIDIENKMFTHRPDLFGILGLAREIAGIQGQKFESPNWYKEESTIPRGEGLELQIKNELPELVSRFMGVCIADVTIAQSPIWLQSMLSRHGIRPINNVVDITNYIMMLTAQPLHAYDYDKVLSKDPDAKVATLMARLPRDNEKVHLINGKEVEPRNDIILITTKTQPIGIAGVMGGLDTEVDENTKNIIIECATFDMYSIRRASMALGVFSDAVTRYSKGQSPHQNDRVLAKTVEMMLELAGGKVASPVIDDRHIKESQKVTVGADFINERLGSSLSAEEISQTLENVEFIVRIKGDQLEITIPFWRQDIAVGEDIVEEVGRLMGYDQLPIKLPRKNITPPKPNPILTTKRNIRNILSSAGANEVLTYSFVHSNLINRAHQNGDLAFKLSNAISPELEYYRLSLTPSLLDKVRPNLKFGFDQFALFEIGKTHQKGCDDDESLPAEDERLSFVFVANDKSAKQFEGSPYYLAKHYLEYLMQKLGTDIEVTKIPSKLSVDQKQLVAPFSASGRVAVIRIKQTGDIIGVVGEYANSVIASYKLPNYCAGFELSIKPLINGSNRQNYIPLPKYPYVEQDISLKVPADLSYQNLYETLIFSIDKLAPKDSHYSLNPLDIFQKPTDETHKQIAFRLSIANYNKTLVAGDVNNLLDKAAKEATEKYGAKRL